jgi:RHS repeat-associated protein
MKRSLLILTSFFFFSRLLVAQAPTVDTQQGIVPASSLQVADIDSVNLGTGNVFVKIPLVSYPQRGGKLRLAFSFYDTNKNWYIYNNGHTSVWTFRLTPAPGGSWVAPDQGIKLKYSTMAWQDANGRNWTLKFITAITTDGATHEILTPNTAVLPGKNTGWSSDATGIWYNGNNTTPTFLDKEGNSYSAPTITNGPGNIIDSNGNEITYSSSGWLDTIGRTIPGYPTTGTMTNAPGVSGSTTNCPSGTVSALQWNAPAYGGTTAPYIFCYSNFSYQTAFNYSGVSDVSGTSLMISAIVLPNLTKYKFNYDAYLSISSITLPTGGTISYTWATSPWTSQSRVIATRTVNANDGTGAHTWTYQLVSSPTYEMIVTDPLGNDQVHTVYNAKGFVTQSQFYSGSHTSGTLIETIANQYTPWTVDPMYLYTNASWGYINVLPTSRTVTWPNGQMMQSNTAYDPGFTYGVLDDTGVVDNYTANYGLTTNESTTDYGQGAVGPILSQKNTLYYWQGNSSYLTANLLTLPQRIRTEDANNNPCAETDYTFDNASYLTSSGIATQHTSPPNSVRGNLSSISKQLVSSSAPCQANPSWTAITSYVNMYDTGAKYKDIDPLGHITSYGYSSTFAGAYATSVTNALSQSSTYNYDFNSGTLTWTKDANLLQTTYAYDSMGRLTQITYPDNGATSITRQETTTPFSQTSTIKINTSQSLISTDLVDGLGRVYRKELTSDPQGVIYTDFTYDALNRTASMSNPYRSGTDITTSTGTTTYSYDVLNRKTSETYPDGSILTTAYCGPSTLVTDPVGKWHRQLVDGLSRLIEVDEPNAIGAAVASTGCRGTGEPIWTTSYSFDNLGNITQVVQNSSHQRTFAYDSLSRVVSSSNPEDGTVTNSYNNDSVLVSTTDARGIITNYSPTASPIDVVHRVTEITYSNSDPTINFYYDQANCLTLPSCQNIGRRTGMTDGSGAEYWSYQVDPANSRTIDAEQKTIKSGSNNITKTLTFYFDLSRNLTEAIYPSGRIVNFTYDSANRPSTAIDGSNGVTYASGFKTSPGGTCITGMTCYTPFGRPYAVSFGQTSSFTGLNITHTFNNRLQPLEFKASSTGGNVFDLTFGFVDPATLKNDGALYKVTNNLNSNRSQSFTYDQLNRVISAGTNATTGTYCWGYQFSYDAWGNLLSQAGWTPTYNSCSQTVMNPVLADGSNHISGFSYDASGNASSDGTYSYSWDGENQLKTSAGVTYSYDGNHRRVSKVGTKLYWYGFDGEILSESDASGNATTEYIFFGGKRIVMLPASGTPILSVEDDLNSSRVLTTNIGGLCYDADFIPFGGERAYTTSCSSNYKFTGKERDSETSNDNFGARYYSNRFGRFLTPDVGSFDFYNPQSLNSYTYALNNPLRYIDPNGRDSIDPNLINSILYFDYNLSVAGEHYVKDYLNGVPVPLPAQSRWLFSALDLQQAYQENGNLTKISFTRDRIMQFLAEDMAADITAKFMKFLHDPNTSLKDLRDAYAQLKLKEDEAEKRKSIVGRGADILSPYAKYVLDLLYDPGTRLLEQLIDDLAHEIDRREKEEEERRKKQTQQPPAPDTSTPSKP